MMRRVQPFHGSLALPAPRPRLQSVASWSHFPVRAVLASAASPFPSGRIPAADNAPSRGKVFWLSTMASAAGVVGTLLWVESFGYFGELDQAGFDGGGQGPGNHDVLCPEGGGIVGATGLPGTIALTAGGGKLAGSGFGRSLAGSAIGVAGGWLTFVSAMFATVGEVPLWVGASPFSLAHGGVTALIAD